MRRFQLVAFLVLGACILLLVPILSNGLTQLNDKPNPVIPNPIKQANPGEEINPDADDRQPKREAAKPARPIRKVTSNPMPWFADLDRDEDGKISPQEWRASRNADDFRQLDLNSDGFISSDELLHDENNTELKLRNGRVDYHGHIEENMEDTYRGRRTFKTLTIKLEKGKTYQIEVTSRVFSPFVALDDENGTQLKQNFSLTGRNSRMTYKPDSAGIYRIVVVSFRTGPFSCTVTAMNSARAKLPKVLDTMLRELDRDADGQIGLFEWQKAGRKVAEFKAFDLNEDGFITLDELLLKVQNTFQLKFENGRAEYNGEADEQEEVYRGKRSFKLLAVKLEAGKTYQIDLTSKVFQAFLYLEGPDGNPLKEHSSPFIGGESHIRHRVDRTGVYRIVATSLGGFRTGPFSCSISIVASSRGPNLPKGLVPWFKERDTDKDGQIGLYEWRKAGKSADEFRLLDLNEDGFLTREELRRYVKKLGK